MRSPDREALLESDAPALAWTRIGPQAAGALARYMSVPEERVQEMMEQSQAEFATIDLTVRAWKIKGDHPTGVATWIINGPFNFAWQWWCLSAVHLRQTEGMPEAKVIRDGASHEVLFVSLHPDHVPDIDALDAGDYASISFLTPVDLTYQVVGLTDEQAAELCGLMIEVILNGRMSPDSDFREAWKPMLDATAEHLRYGTHPGLN